MILVELVGPPDAVLPLAALREHLRLGSGFADDSLQDGLLKGFIRAAMAAVETQTGKVLLARSMTFTVSSWRRPDRQPLPVAPVSAITALTLLPPVGAPVPVAASLWRLEQDWATPALVTASAELPFVPTGGQARVTFEAGYGPAWTDVPADLAQAVLMLAAHYHDFRHDTALSSGCMPFGVTALIERYRPLRLSRGFA